MKTFGIKNDKMTTLIYFVVALSVFTWTTAIPTPYTESSEPSLPYCFAGTPVLLPVDPTYQLVHLQEVMRHGDRTPCSLLPEDHSTWQCDLTEDTELSTEDHVIGPHFHKTFDNHGAWKGNCSVGQLTRRGMAQHMAIGAQLRQMYVDTLPFLGSLYNMTEVLIHSTDVWRTFQSAESQMMGVFPNLATRPDLEIDIHTRAASEEIMLVNPIICPQIAVLQKKVHSSAGYKAFLAQVLPFQKRFAQIFGYDDVTKFDIYALTDNMLARMCHDVPLPSVSPGDVQEMLRLCRLGHELEDTQKITQLAMYPFLSEIVGFMDHAIQEGTNKFVIHSGHDTTIIPLLSAMGVFDGEWPPYASHIFFELWRNHNSYAIRIVYNGNALKLPVCGDVMCPLNVFKRFVAQLVDHSYMQECQPRFSMVHK